MRLSPRLQRCPPGRNGKTDLKGVAEDSITAAGVEEGEEVVAEVATTSTEGVEVVAEGTGGVRCRGAGQIALTSVEVVGTTAITKMEEDIREVAVEDEEDTVVAVAAAISRALGTTRVASKDTKEEEEEEVAIKVVSKGQATQEEEAAEEEAAATKVGVDIRAEAGATSTMVTIKTEAASRIEAAGEAVEGEDEVVEGVVVEEEEEEVKVEDGEEEEGRVLTKAGSLSSTSNRVATSTVSQASGRAGITPAEGGEPRSVRAGQKASSEGEGEAREVQVSAMTDRPVSAISYPWVRTLRFWNER